MKKFTSILLYIISIIAISLYFSQCSQKDGDTSQKVQNQNVSNGTMILNNADSAPVFETIEYIFPQVYEGEKVKYSFKFKNTGSEVLKIKDVNTSCGCAVANKPEDVQPNQSSEINVEFDTTGKVGKDKDNVITIETNSKHKKYETIQLTLKGDVRSIIEHPENINFGQVKNNQSSQSFKINIANDLNETFKIKSVDATPKFIKTEFSEVIPGKEYEIKVSINYPEALEEQEKLIKKALDANPSYKPVKPFPIYGNLTIQMDYQKKPVVYVRVSGELLENVQ